MLTLIKTVSTSNCFIFGPQNLETTVLKQEEEIGFNDRNSVESASRKIIRTIYPPSSTCFIFKNLKQLAVGTVSGKFPRRTIGSLSKHHFTVFMFFEKKSINIDTIGARVKTHNSRLAYNLFTEIVIHKEDYRVIEIVSNGMIKMLNLERSVFSQNPFFGVTFPVSIETIGSVTADDVNRIPYRNRAMAAAVYQQFFIQLSRIQGLF